MLLRPAALMTVELTDRRQQHAEEPQQYVKPMMLLGGEINLLWKMVVI
jgi:hypothetical protein